MLCQFQVFSKVDLLYMYIHLLLFRFFPPCCLVAQSCLTLVTPQTVAHQAPLSKGFSRQEYWSGLLFPSPGDFSDPGIKLTSPALAGGFFTTEPPGKPSFPHSILEKQKQQGNNIYFTQIYFPAHAVFTDLFYNLMDASVKGKHLSFPLPQSPLLLTVFFLCKYSKENIGMAS